jgi:hypothetical protein
MSPFANKAEPLSWPGEMTSSFFGPPEDWSDCLRTALSICLDCGFPSFLWWGSDLIQAYNAAAIPILRGKHPAAFGVPASRSWGEVWPVIGPIAEQVFATGQAVTGSNMPLVLDRGGVKTRASFTFSYSPVRDPEGRVAGVLVIAVETTAATSTSRQHFGTVEGLELMYEQVDSSVALLEGDEHRYLFANAAFRALCGGATLTGVPFGQHAMPLCVPEVLGRLESARATGERQRVEVTHRADDARAGSSPGPFLSPTPMVR